MKMNTGLLGTKIGSCRQIRSCGKKIILKEKFINVIICSDKIR